MKSRLLFIVLLALTPSLIYCQEVTWKDFHFVEAGLGNAHLNPGNDEAAFTVALSNSLGKSVINFIDYNMGFNKSNINNHEFSFKIGPYLRFNNYSYFAVSTGLSYYVGQSESDWIQTSGKSNYVKAYFISIPIQVKINFELAKGFSIGLKGTYSMPIDKNNPYRSTAMMFLGYGWK